MSAITVTPFQPRDRQPLDDLLFRSHYVHTHLDWHDAHQWLDSQPNALLRLAWQDQRLIGALALSAPLNRTTWFRLVVIHDFAPTLDVVHTLWASALEELRAAGVETVSVLLARGWLQPALAALGFQFDEDIITLQRDGQRLPMPLPTPPNVTLREMFPTDLDAVTRLDHRAFAPPWQLMREEIHQARRIGIVSTVATQADTVIGYQISTAYRDGAHLARLAVLPEAQGQGIGAALLADTLRRFFRRGVYSMTVNTQASNHRSQRLYRVFGFERNGNDLPVWTLRLEENQAK